MSEKERYFGKYRGTVRNNVDPMQLGRIMADVPAVTGLANTTWIDPCVPFAGIQSGVFYFPPMGAGVYIEFEGGDVDHPIYVGGYWGSAAEIPVLAQGPPGVQRFVITTQLQTTLVISDVPGPTGGFLFKSKTGATLMINETGIIINNGAGAIISMVGPVVDINGGALTVLK